MTSWFSDHYSKTKVMFRFTTYFPCPQLKPYVPYYSAFESCGGRDGPEVEEVLPMNMAGLHFISEEQAHFIRVDGAYYAPLFPISIIGHLTQKDYNQFRGSRNGALVIFITYGLYRLFGVNRCALAYAAKDAENILARVKLKK
jgi:hypothetical protein